MIRTFFILILLHASLSVSAQSADTEQAWKSSDGKIIQAKFVRLETDAVVIERNGKSFTIPFTKLAPESVQLAKSLKEGTPDGANTTKSETPAAVTEDPTIRFRWLQTDPSTADAIVQTLQANDLSTDAFNAKINLQIKGGKITELAACEREIDTIRNFELETAKHKGMQAIGMEAEATFLPSGLLHLRCNPSWRPNYPKPLGELSCNSSSILSSKHWSLYARWGDARTHTLLLACAGSSTADAKPKTAQAAQLAKALDSDGVVIHLDVEWRELAATHFAELAEMPPNELEAAHARVGRVLRPASIKPENRAEAAAWLRARSRLLASFTSTSRSGQRTSQEQFWGGESLEAGSNKKGREDTPDAPLRQGVAFQWDPTIWAEDARGWQHALSEIRGLDTTIWGGYLRLPSESNSATSRESGIGPKEVQPTLPRPLSLRFEASYIPLNARSKSDGTDFTFVGNPLRPGIPVIYGSKEAPPQGKPVVVLVFTPWYEVIR